MCIWPLYVCNKATLLKQHEVLSTRKTQVYDASQQKSIGFSYDFNMRQDYSITSYWFPKYFPSAAKWNKEDVNSPQ